MLTGRSALLEDVYPMRVSLFTRWIHPSPIPKGMPWAVTSSECFRPTCAIKANMVSRALDNATPADHQTSGGSNRLSRGHLIDMFATARPRQPVIVSGLAWPAVSLAGLRPYVDKDKQLSVAAYAR